MNSKDKFDANKVGDEIKGHIALIESAKGSLIKHTRAAAALLQDVANNREEHFEAVCDRAGLKKSRANELMQIALGRKSEAEVKSATKKRVAKHRAAKRLARPKSRPDSSVTHPVTDNSPATQPDAEASAQACENKYAAMEAQEQSQEANPEPSAQAQAIPEKNRYAKSEKALAEFKFACNQYLALMNGEHRLTAIEYVRALRENLDAKCMARAETKENAA
jgi:hypothetical protein